VTPPTENPAGETDLAVLSGGHTNGHTTDARPIKPIDFGGGRVAFSLRTASSSCPDRGSTIVRNGSCYKCLSCGSTSGCS
jgi:ribonucleoside-diphosphate reductase alpha chain